jgi:hypothetical protein
MREGQRRSSASGCDDSVRVRYGAHLVVHLSDDLQ